MGKNKLGLRRSGGGGKTSRVGGLAKGKSGGLAPDIHLKRPYTPDSLQDHHRDASKTGRIKGLR